jgi:asparaginyl-tRNA synthetase
LKGLDDVLQIQENLILNVIDRTIRERVDSLNYLKIDSDRLKHLKQPFGRLRYDEAIKVLREKNFKVGRNNRVIKWGDDLGMGAERELTCNMTTPLFITHFPRSLRPFYIKHDPQEGHLSLSVDMLAPEGFGEITSGGLRENDVQSLKNELRRRYGDEKMFSWYCDAKMQKFAPHGGFGLGIDRLVRWLTLSRDIRDVMLYPRTPSIIDP